MRRLMACLAVLASTALLPAPAQAMDARQAVYVNLADSLQGSLDDLSASLRGALEANGWSVVAVHDVAVDRSACGYRARVLVASEPRYAAQVLTHGPLAAFALPLRAVLYEDERGTHLATVNLHSVNRTIVAETGFEGSSEAAMRDLVRIAASALHGRFASHPFGQVRDRGLLGRTMGIMAGGPFVEKVKRVYTAPVSADVDVPKIAALVWKGLERGAGKGRWQVRGIYRLDLAAQGVVVIGVSGDALEAKSFAIVGAGGDPARARDRCPGLAHAAAYPIEIVVAREGSDVRVWTIDGMYRMKMYFEDAGKMKFAANMGMPGAIEDEVRGLILSGVGARP